MKKSKDVGGIVKILAHSNATLESWVKGTVFSDNDYEIAIATKEEEHQPDDYVFWVEKETFICIRDTKEEGWDIHLTNVNKDEKLTRVTVNVTPVTNSGTGKPYPLTSIIGRSFSLNQGLHEIMILLADADSKSLLKK